MADINLASPDGKKNIKDTVMNFIVPLVAVVISLLLFIAIIYPSFTKTPGLRNKLDETKTLQSVLKDKLSKINKLVDFKSVVDQDSALVNKLMPDDDDVPGILDQVDQLAKESGLDVSRLSYSFGDTGGTPAEAGPYQSVIVSLGADGNYSQMVQFLKNVENSARLINVTNFRYNASLNEDSAGRLSMTFSLVAPYMKVQSTAVTDDALKLDLTSGEFVSFINRIKGFKFYSQLSADQQSEARKNAKEQAEEAAETTPSEKK